MPSKSGKKTQKVIRKTELPNKSLSKRASQQAKDHKKDFLVVGLGASAGGVKALQEFFATMPPNSGMAFVAILHLSPEHESSLAQIIQTQTAMKVTQVNDTVKVEPDNIYVIPPNMQLEMVDGVIRPVEAVRPHGTRVAIDIFFRTLAEAYERNAVCIVLSGTGSDGTLGLKRVKESNGFAIVQAPEDAEYDSMPKSAINTQLADWILPVHRMPEKLLGFKESSERLHLTDPDAEAEKVAEEIHAGDSLREILALLRVRTGHDFSNYKTPTIVRRIARHLQIHELEDIPSYLELLRNTPGEIQSLLKNLLINVTNFFRDKEAFESLKAEIIPKIFEGKTGKDTVRVWSAGCASGEEAYSLAMLLTEYGDRLADPPKFQIFASDVDDDAIAEARGARYPESIEADVSSERLKRFFTKEGKYYYIKKDLRESVLFAPHNILRDPPFSRLDLVVCRNLLIYLNRETQGTVFQIFHFALKADGFLFLGSAESPDSSVNLFSPVDKKHRLYSRLNAPPAHKYMPAMPIMGRWEVRLPETKAHNIPDRAATLGEIHYRLLEDYAPASVLVNQDFDIVYLSEEAGKFLRFAKGEPSKNLLKMIHPDLLPDLRAALYSAQREHKSAEFPNLRVILGGEEILVDLIVRAIDVSDETRDYLLVIFAEHDSTRQEPPSGSDSAKRKAERSASADKTEVMETVVRRLEEDLQRTREQLRFTVEQHETALEEHRASNEELQATIEELRSASEELETSKEELQSVNEELTTVNHELKDKIDETGKINSDLQNLMAATSIATIFLDKSLKIKRFTPPVEDFFNITKIDIGRPLEHFTHKLNYDDLPKDAARVLKNLMPIEKEIGDKNNRHYLVRFVPYRTIDDRIEGIVLNFIDITDRRRAEEKLCLSEARLQKAIGIETVGVIFFNNEFEITDCNEAFARMSGYTCEELKAGRFNWQKFTPDGFLDVSSRALVDINTAGIATPYEKEYVRKDGTRFWALFAAKRIGKNEIVEFVTDITERKQFEERQEFLLKLSDALRSIADADEIETAACRILGEQLGAHRVYYVEIFEPEGTTRVRKQYLRGGAASIAGEYTIEAFDWTAAPLRRGEAVVVSDVHHSALVPPEYVAAMEAVQQTSVVLLPLIKEGVWVGVLTVGDDATRDWKETEVELARETLERMWAAAERARTEEALAESEEKYRTLFDSIDEGYALFDLLYDRKGKPVDLFYIETNAAFERMNGFSGTGKKLSEILGELEPFWYETYDRVVKTGEPVRVENNTEMTDAWYSVYCSRVGGEGSPRVATVFDDITTRKRTEANLAFLAEVSQDLAHLTNIDGTMDTLSAKIGEYFNVSRVVFSEISEDQESGVVNYEWHQSDLPSMKDTYRTKEYFTPEFERLHNRGELAVVRDIKSDWRIDAERYARLGVGSFVGVPLIREGKWRFYFSLLDFQPHDWRADELELLREISNRIWTRLERERAEIAVRESEEKLRSVFDSIDDGFAVIEMIFDREGASTDFIYREVNPAFITQTGLNPIGKRRREVLPEVEQSLLDNYGEVAKTGKPLRQEYQIRGLGDQWFQTTASRIGEAGSNRVAVVFRNITERRRAEEKQTFLLKLSDALRPLSDAAEIKQAATRLLGEHLNVNRAFYADAKNDHWIVATGYERNVEPLPDAPFAMADFGQWIIEDFRAGGDLIVPDVRHEKRFKKSERTALEAIQIRAAAGVPLVKNETLVAMLCLHTNEPRDWNEQEIRLLREVAERTWAAVERGRAEALLRESEERLRALVENLPGGAVFIVNRDLRYVVAEGEALASAGFSPQDLIGRTISEAMPPELIEGYESLYRKALAGEPFDYEHEAHNRTFISRGVPLAGMMGEIYAVLAVSYDITERKQAEEALRVSESRLQKAIQIETVGVLFFDTDGNFLSANDAFLRQIGYTRPEFEQRQLKSEDVTLPEWMPRTRAALEELKATGRFAPYEKELMRPDGTRSWALCAGTHLSETEGVEYVVDVTDLKNLQEIVRESEERLRIAVEAAEMATWDWNLIKNEVTWNEQHFLLFGMTPSVKPQRPEAFSDHVHPDDREWVMKRLEQAVETNTTFTAEFRVVRQDGKIRWMEGYGHVVETENGKPVRMSGVMSDITSRKRAEEAVRLSEERLQLIMRSINDYAIITCDTDGIINGWNTGAENTFGWTAKEAIGQPCALIFTLEDRAAKVPECEMQTALEKGVAEDTRWHVRKDGSRFFASGTVSPIRNGELDGFVKITSDQTARMEAEAALREKETLQKLVTAQEDERKRIARDLHDELGQQLTALRIRLDAVSSSQQEPVLRNQLHEIQNIARSIDDGVDFLAWELRPSSLDDLGLTAALDNFIKQWSRYSGVRAELTISNLKRARFAPEVETCLYRIVQESLNNTHKYAKATNADVILEKRGDMVILIIEDNGVGFNRKSKINRAKGMGLLGMKERAQLVGGTLEIETAPKHGTTIYVRIPFSAAKEK